jgi:hypothetical protein
MHSEGAGHARRARTAHTTHARGLLAPTLGCLLQGLRAIKARFFPVLSLALLSLSRLLPLLPLLSLLSLLPLSEVASSSEPLRRTFTGRLWAPGLVFFSVAPTDARGRFIAAADSLCACFALTAPLDPATWTPRQDQPKVTTRARVDSQRRRAAYHHSPSRRCAREHALHLNQGAYCRLLLLRLLPEQRRRQSESRHN